MDNYIYEKGLAGYMCQVMLLCNGQSLSIFTENTAGYVLAYKNKGIAA